jgi:hypothetical protein
MFVKRGIILLALTILLMSTVSALTYSNNIRDMLPQLQELTDTYNANFDKVPSWVKPIVGSEKINVLIVMNDNSLIHIGLILNSGKIVAMRQGRLKDSTINLYLKESQIKKILDLQGSAARINRIKQLYDDDLISYEPVSFRAKAKLDTVGFALRVLT